MNNVKKSLIFITALCSISQLYPMLEAEAPGTTKVIGGKGGVIGGKGGVIGGKGGVIGGKGGAIGGKGGAIGSKGGKDGYQNVPGGQGRAINHSGSSTAVPPIFKTLETTSAKGEKGFYMPLLKFLWFVDSLGNTTYVVNATPKIPATLSPAAKEKYTSNLATVTFNEKLVPLHGIVMTPAVTEKVKTGYNNLLNLIPDLMGAAALVDLQSLTNLYTAFKTLLPAQPVDVVA